MLSWRDKSIVKERAHRSHSPTDPSCRVFPDIENGFGTGILARKLASVGNLERAGPHTTAPPHRPARSSGARQGPVTKRVRGGFASRKSPRMSVHMHVR